MAGEEQENELQELLDHEERCVLSSEIENLIDLDFFKTLPDNWTEISKYAALYYGLDFVDEYEGRTKIHFPEIKIVSTADTKDEHIIKDLIVMFNFDSISLLGTRFTYSTKELDKTIYKHSHLSGSTLTDWGEFCLGESSFKITWTTLKLKDKLDYFDYMTFLSELNSYLSVENVDSRNYPYKKISSLKHDSTNININYDALCKEIFTNDNLFEQLVFTENNFKLPNSYDFWKTLSIISFKLNPNTVGIYNYLLGHGEYIDLEQATTPYIAHNFLPNLTINFKDKTLPITVYEYQEPCEIIENPEIRVTEENCFLCKKEINLITSIFHNQFENAYQ